MTAPTPASLPPSSALPAADDAQLRRSIDGSLNRPVVFFFVNALLWLFFGTLGGVVAAVKLNNPGFFDNVLGVPLGALTYGRQMAAYEHMWIYGWCFQAAFGVLLWLTGRLTRATLRFSGPVTAAAFLWNLAVTVGVVSIFLGRGTGFAWLEFPGMAVGGMLISYGVIALAALDMIARRRQPEPFVSLWYVASALLWFPILFLTAQLLLQWMPLTGVMAHVVNVWFRQGLVGLWFVPLGLATAYYLIPKVTGRPVHGYSLAAFGFWILFLVSPWNAGAGLVGGPFPAWMITVGIAANIFLLIPAGVVLYNLGGTLAHADPDSAFSPTLRFTLFGLLSYVVASGVAALTSLRTISGTAQHSVFAYGHFHLMFYAFFSMILFAAMYFILPRMVGCEWVSSRLISWHFFISAYGVCMLVFFWAAQGFIHGAALNKVDTAHLSGFLNVVRALKLIIWMQYIPTFIVAFSQAIFLFHFILMLLRLGRVSGGPTLLPGAHAAGGVHG